MCDISNYEKLANAIVIQAAQDYLTETKALKKLLSHEPPPDPPKPPKQDGDDKERKKKGIHEKWEDKCNGHRFELASIERFFHSQWRQMLTDADGDAIFQKLKQEAEKI